VGHLENASEIILNKFVEAMRLENVDSWPQ
jgi:hypothetical protein